MWNFNLTYPVHSDPTIGSKYQGKENLKIILEYKYTDGYGDDPIFVFVDQDNQHVRLTRDALNTYYQKYDPWGVVKSLAKQYGFTWKDS